MISECSLFMYSEEERAGSARIMAAKKTEMDNIVMVNCGVGVFLVANESRLAHYYSFSEAITQSRAFPC